MKKIVFVLVGIFGFFCSTASAVDVNVGWYLTDALATRPKLSMFTHFDNNIKKIENTLVRTTTMKSACIEIDTQQSLAGNDRGIVIKASNGNAGNDTWWMMPYTTESSIQKFCLNTAYAYDLTVYWEALLESDSLLEKNAVNFKFNRENAVNQVNLNALTTKKTPLVSPQLYKSAIQCGDLFCTDQGFIAPGMGKGITVDKGAKLLIIRFGDAIPADWFNGDTSGATQLCLRSNTAGWSGPDAYCAPVALSQSIALNLPVDANQNIVDEEFTFTIETPNGSVWSNNNVLVNFTTGLVLSGSNFKVAP